MISYFGSRPSQGTHSTQRILRTIVSDETDQPMGRACYRNFIRKEILCWNKRSHFWGQKEIQLTGEIQQQVWRLLKWIPMAQFLGGGSLTRALVFGCRRIMKKSFWVERHHARERSSVNDDYCTTRQRQKPMTDSRRSSQAGWARPQGGPHDGSLVPLTGHRHEVKCARAISEAGRQGDER